MHKLELKHIHASMRFSRETFCYTATLYLNGKKAADIDSDGRGGEASVYFTDPTTRNLVQQYFLEQPRIPLTLSDGLIIDYQPDLDSWAAGQVEAYLKKQSARKAKALPKKSASEYRIVD